MIAVCWVLAFHALFYSQTLYNSGATEETRIGRMQIALAAFLPASANGTNLLVEAASRLSHFENLPQRLPIYGLALAIVLVSLAVGDLLTKCVGLQVEHSFGERIVVAFGLGTGTISLLTQLLGLCAVLSRSAAVTIAAVSVTAWLAANPPWRWRFRCQMETVGGFSLAGRIAIVLAVAPFIILALLAAALPTTDFDAHAYHLLGPKEYWQAGSIEFLPHNVYTTFPFLTEMFHLLAMTALDDWSSGGLAGQVTLALFGPFTALAVGMLAARLFSVRAAWFAALVYMTAPWTYRLMIIPYVEGAMLCYTVLAVYAAIRSDGNNWRWALVGGAFSGLAIACKYPGLLMAALPSGAWIAIRAGRQKHWRAVLAWSLGVVVFIGPWFVRNTVWTGNPVYPLLYQVFGGVNWSAAKATRFDRGHRATHFSLSALWRYIAVDWRRHSGEIPLSSDWQTSLVFGFAPLALLIANRRSAWGTWFLVGYLFAVFWLLTHRLDRFWLPLEPFVAALAGAGMTTFDRPAWRRFVVAVTAPTIAFNLAFCTTGLCGLNDYTADLAGQRNRNLRFEPAMLVANELLYRNKPGCSVLFVGFAAVYEAQGIARYNTVFDDNLLEQFARRAGAEGRLRSPGEVRTRLRAEHIDYIVVDWTEIARYRAPGSYGYTKFIEPELFRLLCENGVLQEIPLFRRGQMNGETVHLPLLVGLPMVPATADVPLNLYRVVDKGAGG